MSYISKEDLILKIMANTANNPWILLTEKDTDLYHLVAHTKALEKIINEMPSANVQENTSAHYIAESDGYADGYPVYDMWYCSNCDYCFEEYDEMPPYKYCPNCGAKFER